MSLENEMLIKHERLRSVFLHASVTTSVSIIIAVLVAVVLGSETDYKVPAAWAAGIAVISVVRLIGCRRFLRLPLGRPLRRWVAFSVLGSLANGVLWGIAAGTMFPSQGISQLFLALAICGMCAGAVTVSAAHFPTVLAFILPASLPLGIRFLLEGPPWRMPALMVLVFAASLCIISMRGHRAFGDGVRLHLALDAERRKLKEANQHLQQEATQRRAAEATLHQAQKMEAIGHLTGGIAHDFNNLLQVMIGNLNLIRRVGEADTRVVGYALAAEQAAMRGAELTTSLLTFARRQSLRAECVNLNGLVKEFEPILMRALGAKIACEVKLAAELAPCRVDPAHFQSAVLNLVINARDAMPDGGVLTIATGQGGLGLEDLAGNEDAIPGPFVFVSVRDTGTGMTHDVMARMFEPFFTTKEAGKGSGLGLPQIYGFARQSGGHIQLISAPGRGTEAILWLPVAGPSSQSPTSPDLA